MGLASTRNSARHVVPLSPKGTLDSAGLGVVSKANAMGAAPTLWETMSQH